MAAEEGDIVTFIFTGVEGEVIPRNATRFIAHESVTVIPARLFYQHPNIVELICHAGVVRIEGGAFLYCPRLRRLMIPGVKAVQRAAFCGCKAVTYVECPKLETIGVSAFKNCTSLSNINLPSAKVVEGNAFAGCEVLTDVKFGKSLESIRWAAFCLCPSLERITIPLKDGLFAAENIFQACVNLKSLDLVEGAALREIIAALLLEEWRNDMNEEIDSINQILPNTPAGEPYTGNVGEKARAIREWVERVLRKIIQYKAEHLLILNDAATSLQLRAALPSDIVLNNVVPFLHLPSHTFEGEEDNDDDEDSSDDE